MSKDKMESESEDEYTIASITSLHQSKRQKDMKLSRQNQADKVAELILEIDSLSSESFKKINNNFPTCKR